MDYTIYTIGGGEFLINILKGMTALTSSSAYIGILKTVAMFGLLWILLEVSFAGKFARSFKWFFGMFIAFNLLFVPKVTVIVEDKLNPQLKDNIIANVPFAVGVVGHFTSLAGDKMTELTETAYNSGMEYNKYGLLASVNVTDAVSRAKIGEM
jgi:conjugal transfer mating pair stabilization protein TraG